MDMCSRVCPNPHHSLMYMNFKCLYYSLASIFKNKELRIAEELWIFRKIGNFKNQKPSIPLVSFQSEWKTALKQNACWKKYDIWLRLEIRSPYEVHKISFQNSFVPSSLPLRWKTPVISTDLEEGTLGF